MHRVSHVELGSLVGIGGHPVFANDIRKLRKTK